MISIIPTEQLIDLMRSRCAKRWWGSATVKPFEVHRTDAAFELRLRAEGCFKAEHDLTEEEFRTEHWQALFAVVYPEVQR